jgi:hypothetical protein
MKRTVLALLAMSAVAVLSLCTCASADIIGVTEVPDYQYHASVQNGTWAEVLDPGYGAPDWFTLPFSLDQWIAIPNQERLDEVKTLWFQVEVEPGTTIDVDPLAWASQGFTVTGGTDPTRVEEAGHTYYVWEWTITPQPDSEFLQISNLFPWSNVIGIDVATKCVPEPSTLILAGCGLFGLILVWRRRQTA